MPASCDERALFTGKRNLIALADVWACAAIHKPVAYASSLETDLIIVLTRSAVCVDDCAIRVIVLGLTKGEMTVFPNVRGERLRCLERAMFEVKGDSEKSSR